MDFRLELQRFNLEDIPRLTQIMEETGERPKDWAGFVKWNIDNPEDPYWKIVLVSEESSIFIGYIGYAQADRKPTTKKVAKQHDLFLEIYIDSEFTGKGIGEEAFIQSLALISKKSRRIFASTYISNVRAQKFFSKKLDMKISHYDTRFNVVIYVKDL